MIILYIISIILVSLAIALILWDVFCPDMYLIKCAKNITNKRICDGETQQFSLSEYFSKIEKEHIKLLQERERNPVSKVIELWCGLDGIRLNSDGTTETISKRGQKKDMKNERFPTGNCIRPGTEVPTGNCIRPGTEVPTGNCIRPGTEVPTGNCIRPGTEVPTGNCIRPGTEVPTGNCIRPGTFAFMQSTQAIESSARTIQLQIEQFRLSQSMVNVPVPPYIQYHFENIQNALNGMPLFMEGMCNCCTTKRAGE